MSALDKKKCEVELMRVRASKAELELRIDERLEEIERVKEHIKIQDDKIKELEIKLKSL